jgi:hypothetical protein
VVTPKRGPTPGSPGSPHEPTSSSARSNRIARRLIARARAEAHDDAERPAVIAVERLSKHSVLGVRCVTPAHLLLIRRTASFTWVRISVPKDTGHSFVFDARRYYANGPTYNVCDPRSTLWNNRRWARAPAEGRLL